MVTACVSWSRNSSGSCYYVMLRGRLDMCVLCSSQTQAASATSCGPAPAWPGLFLAGGSPLSWVTGLEACTRPGAAAVPMPSWVWPERLDRDALCSLARGSLQRSCALGALLGEQLGSFPYFLPRL